jgi:predicted CXXCH cytochrome family protein
MPRTIQPGTPTRSPRYLIPMSGSRLTLLSLAGAVVALVLGAALYVTGMHGVASPGHVASAHSAIDGRCADCHQPAKAVTDVRCERCHDPLDARRFGSPAHAALAGSSANAAHIAQVDCAVCHAEHRGLSVNLVKTDDRRCTSCHTFGSFRSHPELAVVRAKREPDPGLDFSHEIHLKEVAKLGGDRCQVCHQLTPDQRGYEPISFDAHCAKCHIKDRVLTLNGADALKSLPTPATLLPAAVPGQTMPATESRDERGRVILTGFSHRDSWVLAAADGISRMMDTPGISLERARLVSEIERVSAIAQAVPVASLADADLESLATALRADVQALDRQIAAGPSAAAAEATTLQPIATAVDPSGAALAGQLGQAPARAATNAPSDAQQLEERRRELTELLDAVAARATGPLAARAADLRKQAAALKADPPSAGAPDAKALADRLKAVDVALAAAENAAGPAAVADVEAARDGVDALTGAAGAPRAVARHDLFVLIDAIAARGDQATRARAADLRAAVASLPDGASDSLAVRRDGKARLLDRVELEVALRRDSGPAPVDAVSQTERSTAAHELQTLRARLATIDARLTTSPQLDSARGRAALHGLLGACVQCHRLNDDETALRPVAPSQSLLTSAAFTHKPHLLQAKCETCHQTIATSKAGVDANVPGIANCQGCHNASQARADCVACHEYHPRSASQVAMSLWR